MSQFGPDPPFPQTGGKYSGLVGGGLVTGGGGGVLDFLRKGVFVYYCVKRKFCDYNYLGGGGGGGGLVGIEHSGLLAPFVQQYCPFPPLSQQSALFAPKVAWISITKTFL